MFIKNKEDHDYSDVVIGVYNDIRDKYSYSARVTDIWELLRIAFYIPEFELLDTKYCFNGNLESFLVEQQIKWQRGENVDFSEIKDIILSTGDFSYSEKMMFECGNFEERLWAIYLSICSPSLNI